MVCRIRNGPVVIGNGEQALIGVCLPLQIALLTPPDIGHVLGGAAVGGVVHGVLHQITVIIQPLALRGLHSRVALLRRIGRAAAPAIVDLAAGGAAHVKAVGRPVFAGPAGVGPGADRLGLQCLHGPVAAHFVGDDALYVGFQIQHVIHIQVAAGDPGIFKGAAVLVALEPGGGLPFFLLRLYRQVKHAAAVKFKQHIGGAGHGHHHARGGGTGGVTLSQQARGLRRLVLGAIAAHTDHISPVHPGGIAAVVFSGIQGLLIVPEAVDLNVPGAQIRTAAIRGISPAATHITGGSHGNGRLIRPAQGFKKTAVIEIAKCKPTAQGVLQIGGKHGRGAIAQAHGDRVIRQSGGGNGAQGEKCHNEEQCQQLFFHGTSQYQPP